MGIDRYLWLFIICFSWSLFTVPIVSVAEEAELSNDDIYAQWTAYLHECYKKVFSIQGEFTQEVECGSKPVESKLRGRFKVKRHGMYRWEYLVPEGHTMVSDGKLSVVYDGIESRMIVSHSADPLLTAVSKLLTGETEDFFFAEVLSVLKGKEQSGVIQLTPKESNPYILAVVITISKETPFFKRILIVDRAGCFIRTTFHNAEINKGIRNSVFHFNASKNTSVTEP
jgi:chaperone LolA